MAINPNVTNSATDTRSLSETIPSIVDGHPGKAQVFLMGLGFIILGLFLAYLLLSLWPTMPVDPANSPGSQIVLFNVGGGGFAFTVTLDTQLLLLVMVCGTMGSFVHIATSFSDYVGNERLSGSWFWWYILRPMIGMILAVIFYVAIRGGFLSAGSQSTDINPFAVAALAALVGMFSKQATDKLNEVFDTLFKTDTGDEKRKNSLENPMPIVSDVTPRTLVSGAENLLVVVTGSGFVKGAAVSINGLNRETTFIDKTKITATLLPDDVDAEGEIELRVCNPEPGGGHSVPIKLKIMPVSGSSS